MDKYTIPLNSKVCILTTMNPNYTGRKELPNNLKSLLRPIGMVTPNIIQIAENILYSDGNDFLFRF